MRPLTERDVRASFVNCTKGEAKRLAVPRDLADRPWDDLDFLGWRDPASPERAYLVAEHEGTVTGIALRRATRGTKRRVMCTLCLTTHDEVSLMTARKARERDNSVGAYLCADLACSLYLRGRKDAGPGSRLQESLTPQEQIDRTTANLAAFLARVL
ncbi:hypothetical protein BLA60_03635 [Actinophytocola xinjiangensis]|uniref:Elongation factor G-binding protein C-terminal treble-clef zinc-finger domain-containing protein n=1 Tax=Actinophytocola xinjiangensis TaxID=485602 RepID=A0A7Z0WT19_9PSEU|nr:FBP domain-containing protein [Actinophytocola xinjiangensis]OLF14237.1 hypothetical protein BLA60_03635 [Actinophytocola xinjiangensis]